MKAALDDAGLSPRDVEGLVTFTMDSNEEAEVARNLGIPMLTLFSRIPYGGGGACAVVMQAAMAVATGAADVVVCYRAFNERSGMRYGGAALTATMLPPFLDMYDEQRNVLVESARIARGKIKEIKQFKPSDFDALILPGGTGVAKNLCTYAFDGPNCKVNDDLARMIKAMHAAGKPIGARCIAPVILARVLGDVKLTIGQDQETAQDLAAMGARHTAAAQGAIVVDRANKIVTSPCYMLQSRVDQIAEGAENLIKAVLEFCG